MKTRVLTSLAAALSMAAIGATMPRLANADMVETSKQVTTSTTYSGTVSEIQPSSSTIVIKSESSPQPMRYMFNEKTTFIDASGNVVQQESIRNQPVTVYYQKDGDELIASKVVVTKQAPMMREKKTTTSTTTETR
jgi:hypothetical protein